MEQRVIQTQIRSEDYKNDNVLRPKRLTDYIGQEHIKADLSVYIEAAKKRSDALDHVLLYGPPGLGKTTLSCILANEMGVNIKITSGPALEKTGDLASILTKLHKGDILFIDEIHRMNRQIEEFLYPAMEDFCVDIMLGNGPEAKSMRLDVPKFTLIGATTRAGLLTAPLRDRFGIIHRLEFYTTLELKTIIKNSAANLGIEIEEDGALEIAKRSRGTPRIANRLLKRIRDYAFVKYNGIITNEVADEVLSTLDIDSIGLDNIDRKILSTIIDKFNGGPVGLDTLAATIGEDSGTIEDVYEPFLLQNGFINRTPKGRMVTMEAYKHLGINLLL